MFDSSLILALKFYVLKLGLDIVALLCCVVEFTLFTLYCFFTFSWFVLLDAFGWCLIVIFFTFTSWLFWIVWFWIVFGLLFYCLLVNFVFCYFIALLVGICNLLAYWFVSFLCWDFYFVLCFVLNCCTC